MRQLQKNIHYSHTSVYHSVNMTKKVEEGFVQTRSFDVFILQNIVAEHYNAEKKTQFSITEIFGCGKNKRQIPGPPPPPLLLSSPLSMGPIAHW